MIHQECLSHRRVRSGARSIACVWRASAVVRWGTLGVLLALYAVLSLEPFTWRVPDQLPNGAVRLTEGWGFPTAGIVIADPPLEWLQGAADAETLELSLVVRPRSTAQSGPARILTISPDAYLRNLTLAQDHEDLVLRLRSQDTGINGMRGGRPVARLENVFRAGVRVAIDVRIRPRQLTIGIDGRQALQADLPPSVLGTWSSSYGLALGNEMTCNRPWLGEIRQAVISGPDGAKDYARTQDVAVPATCRVFGHAPKLVPFRSLIADDALRNVVMYVPLGCLLGLMVRARKARTFVALLLAIVGVSSTFECAQIFLPSRYPSVDDIIFNALGGALGLWLAFWLTRRLSAMPASDGRATDRSNT